MLLVPAAKWGDNRLTAPFPLAFLDQEPTQPKPSPACECCSLLFSLEQLSSSLIALLYCVVPPCKNGISACKFPKCCFNIYFHLSSYYCGNMDFEFH